MDYPRSLMPKLRFIFGYGRARICALRVCGSPLFLLHDFVIRTSYFKTPALAGCAFFN